MWAKVYTRVAVREFKIPFVLFQDPNIKVVNPSINPCALLAVTTFA